MALLFGALFCAIWRLEDSLVYQCYLFLLFAMFSFYSFNYPNGFVYLGTFVYCAFTLYLTLFYLHHFVIYVANYNDFEDYEDYMEEDEEEEEEAEEDQGEEEMNADASEESE